MAPIKTVLYANEIKERVVVVVGGRSINQVSLNLQKKKERATFTQYTNRHFKKKKKKKRKRGKIARLN